MLVAGLTLLYLFGSNNSFGDALIEKGGLFIILLVYPAVWFYHFIMAPSRMDAEDCLNQ